MTGSALGLAEIAQLSEIYQSRHKIPSITFCVLSSNKSMTETGACDQHPVQDVIRSTWQYRVIWTEAGSAFRDWVCSLTGSV